MTIATAEVHEHDRDMDLSKFEEALQDALSQLDETKRTTFELRFVHELSNPEIAETMGCSEGTVKSRIFYTLKELNSILHEYKELLLSFLFIILQSSTHKNLSPISPKTWSASCALKNSTVCFQRNAPLCCNMFPTKRNSMNSKCFWVTQSGVSIIYA